MRAQRRSSALALSSSRRTLLALVYRKLLASSTYAIAPTLTKLAEGLKQTLEGSAPRFEPEEIENYRQEEEWLDSLPGGNQAEHLGGAHLGLKLQQEITELESYGTAATTDKYLDQIKQRAAEAKASVEVATGGMNVERIKVERKARQLQAQSILAEFETQMGLKKPDATKEVAPFPATPEGVESAPVPPERTPEAK